MMKSDLIFCSVIFPDRESEINALMLAESIREFGGKFARNPVWFAVPGGIAGLSGSIPKRLQELDVRFVPFQIEQQKLQLFFTDELNGLAVMETASEGECEFFAWMDANTLLLNEPVDFLLPQGKVLGYRPVHHLLIGSCYDAPLDDFWALVYRNCRVQPERIFPMQPVVEQTQMRAYFNAGFLVVKSGRGLMRQWHQEFSALGQSPDFQPFYHQDQRYAIFMHQAVLAGVVLRNLDRREMVELPCEYNYPVHLYDQDITSARPSSIDSLVTIRHEGFYKDVDWRSSLPASEGLKQWLAKKLDEIHI